MADTDSIRSRMRAARQQAYCAAAYNPRSQTVTLTLGEQAYTVRATGPLTIRAQNTRRDARTTVSTTTSSATFVASKAEVPEVPEVRQGYYGKLEDEDGTEWRIVGIVFADDAVWHLRLSVSSVGAAGASRK